MKKIVLVSVLGLLMAFLLFGDEGIPGEDQILENISQLIAGLELMPEASTSMEKVREFLRLFCETILLVAPEANVPQNIQTEIKDILKDYSVSDRAILDETSVQPFWKAARFIDPEFDLQIPENATVETIKEDIRLELHKARSSHDQGNAENVLEILLRMFLRIVTPIER